MLFFGLLTILSITVCWGASNNYCENCEDYLLGFPSCKYNATIDEDVIQISQRNGFKAINISMTTDDGYKISMTKVWKTTTPNGLKPVLFLHGMAANIRTFFLDDLDSLALRSALIRLTYVINFRGNKGSLGHTTLDTNTPAYWNFTFEDTRLDVKSAINYIKQDTGSNKVDVVCHSLGCAIFACAAILDPQIRQSISSVIIIAPAIFVTHNNHPFEIFIDLVGAESFPVFDVVTGGHVDLDIVESCTGVPNANMLACREFYQSYFGESDYIQYCRDIPVLTTAIGAIPAKYVTHQYQNSRDESFNRYDWGPTGNVEKYGQATPPKYDLSLLTMPKTFICFNNDQIAFVNNTQKVADETPDPKTFVELPPSERMCHIDCMKSDGLSLIWTEVEKGLSNN